MSRANGKKKKSGRKIRFPRHQSEIQSGLFVQPPEKRMHIAGTTPRNPFSRFGEHPSRQVAQFHQIFTVSGVLATVCGGVDRLGCRIVQPRMFPPGKEKRTPDSDRAGIRPAR